MTAGPSQPPIGATREHGFALLIVLWTLGLLALIGTQITGSARLQTRLAGNLRANAVVEAAADGAARQAVLRLLQGAWRNDDLRRLRVGAAMVEIRLADQAGRVNPNATTYSVLQGLLANLGLDQPSAAALGKAIVDWRTGVTLSLSGGTKLDQYRAAGLSYGPANRPFESIDEIGLVLGMTPTLLARLKPYVSVYQEGEVRRGAAGSVAARALDEARLADPNAVGADYVSPNRIILIRATAISGAARFTRQTVVRIQDAPSGGVPYQFLTWETGGE